ncbi:KAT8 regulatory NSL complex subunit 1-like isoform X1 [Corythoichthys intestinalis]|uniref:KAT8 regulatory NSL complex subunit 1-like isoform X1 n=1 Tax=Corythoichthys intestinalis TaxID=161448 RepID=UPI0025A52E72|nr:KAT8 regulatory NSL complex subunit 1-like isoform X1 [Corythoichthys intestinalis]XP_057682002.1 KAT8 regulatory NSL complex subunit 1-like isoform X1 [Corythoichthys intestinalis]XP_057682003.1 KAT8 regulatory NSL complex subunit 1-like isoform X1 [Corythoichthys intestinalis]XP_057682004.1 KAT8 regulatory NSL complex subunit 1-like isoform X1 [Corythoichthys intestinalis]XP_057682005.1 KAT8 regulatory NSL complex subunit 1-like isoform X1 [Corythoichthys intestinalis]
MAAMAPALTDAPAEAHHIRFKLAAPSSSLSPASAENHADPGNILIRGSPKCKVAPEDARPPDSQDQKQQQLPAPPQGDSLGKLQPLVASYLCSDVTPVPSGKESITLQGVLIKQSVLKSHRILPGSLLNGGDFLLRKRHAVELSGGRLKGLMSAADGGGRPAAPPVNGLAKKLAAVSGRASLNGDEPPPADGTPEPDRSPGVCPDRRPAATMTPPGPAEDAASSPSRSDRERPGPPSRASPSDARVGERARLNGCRQAEIEGRLRRLRKRLQVVQAKQVERHVQQQLGGFLDSAVGRLLAGGRRDRAASSSAAPWRRHPGAGDREALARFLKSGSVPLELERLYLSGSANLRSAEKAFDSDVTESSSGGDSDLEEDQLSRADVEQRHVKIWKRAESRYTTERAAIISHWNWLQAHISDLEYRIRQQTDIFRQIRASKGSVELGGLGPQEAKTEQTDTQEVCLEHAGAAEPWKGQNGQPLNGVLSRVTESVEGACAAARTRPLIGWRRRRLVRPDAVADLNGKASRRSGGGACGVNPACVMCGGRPVPREDPQFELPVLERLSRLDPGVHPILSFPDDVGAGLRVQQAMKSCWSGRSLERSKPLKKFSLKHKLSSSKEKHKFASSLMAVRLSHYKNRADKSRTPEGCKTERLAGASVALPPYDKGYGRKRSREHSADRSDAASPKFFTDSSAAVCPPLSGVHSPVARQLSASSDVPPGALLQPVKRRRGESSFDINNIVIPMSVAATTRVEKLQYKEIITPSWRAVDIPPAPDDDDREVEDLSDAAFVQLHQPYEDQERSRWTWMALAPAKRRGSRSYKSADGRTTPLLCGTNPPTPQPASPEHDYGHLASPLSPPSPDTPCSRDSHRPVSSEDTRCSTPDLAFEERTVAPWERRNFPLAEDPAPEPEPRSPPSGRRRDWDDAEPPCCRDDEPKRP